MTEPQQSPTEQIMHTYWDLFMTTQIDLARFCERLAAGDFGPYTKEQITDFLYEIEASIMQNIETMLTAHPHLAPLRDERSEETRQMIDDLITRFGSH